MASGRGGFTLRPGVPLDVNPHQQQHEQRPEYVDEHHQGEEAAAQRRAVEKVIRDRLAEHRQGIEPLGRRERNVLRELVPYEPVAADATEIDECEQRHARQPGEEPAATQPVKCELAKNMQNHDDDERIGCIAVQAAHDAGRVPLVMRDVLDRRIRIRDARVEEDIQVDTGRRDDPVEIPAQCTQQYERVVALAESVLEDRLETRKSACQGTFDQCHTGPIGRVAIP